MIVVFYYINLNDFMIAVMLIKLFVVEWEFKKAFIAKIKNLTSLHFKHKKKCWIDFI